MNELKAIIDAYETARAAGEKAALATVVSVAGSAYRRPGARMLLTESGRRAGGISGGCLERDAEQRMAEVMASGKPCVVEYDTRGDDDILWGHGQGCNGVVQILIESLYDGSPAASALDFAAGRLRDRRAGVLPVVIGSRDPRIDIGERLPPDTGGNVGGPPSLDRETIALIRAFALERLSSRSPSVWSLQGARGSLEIFFDVILPPQPLVIFGAEPDAIPLVRLAGMLGWHVTIVDTRARRDTRERFAEADDVLLCRVEELESSFPIERGAAIVIMTHNYLDDRVLLPLAAKSGAAYVGVLGPRRRTARLMSELPDDPAESKRGNATCVHGPIGLDLGAETPEEIALAIAAEIKAVMAKRAGRHLCNLDAPLHGRDILQPESPALAFDGAELRGAAASLDLSLA